MNSEQIEQTAKELGFALLSQKVPGRRKGTTTQHFTLKSANGTTRYLGDLRTLQQMRRQELCTAMQETMRREASKPS